MVVKYNFKANMVVEYFSSLHCLHYLVFFDQTACIFTKVCDQALQQALSSDVYVQTLIHNFNSVLSFLTEGSTFAPNNLEKLRAVCLSKEAINLDCRGKVVMRKNSALMFFM